MKPAYGQYPQFDPFLLNSGSYYIFPHVDHTLSKMIQ